MKTLDIVHEVQRCEQEVRLETSTAKTLGREKVKQILQGELCRSNLFNFGFVPSMHHKDERNASNRENTSLRADPNSEDLVFFSVSTRSFKNFFLSDAGVSL